MQNLSYVAEHQENLQVVQVLLSIPQTVDWSAFTAETDVSGLTGPMGQAMVALKSSAGGQTACLDLPTPVTAWQRIVLKDLPSPTEFKLRAERSATAHAPALNMVITHALSAPELRRMQPTALACQACDRELADLSTVSSTGQWERGAGFKDLPSEHWAEMLEAWMCHADDGFTNQLTERTKDGFWPVEGTVLVGGSYMLVDANDTCQQNLRIDGKVSVSDSVHLSSPPGLKRRPSLHLIGGRIRITQRHMTKAELSTKLLQVSDSVGQTLCFGCLLVVRQEQAP